MSSPQTRLVVVDISSFIFRAFYAVRMLNAPDGTPVNAVHGVLSMLLKLLSDYRPTHFILARDSKGPSFRNELYDQYKANRSAPPEELVPQFELIAQLMDKMEAVSIQRPGFEADDLIGSLVVQWQESFDEVLIASGDKDLMQFCNEKVKIVDTMKGKIYGINEVFEKMGVYPHQIVDYLSMVGDASDNIPGLPGVGAKTAAKLLAQHGDFDSCVKAVGELKGKRVIEAFTNHLELGRLSKELVKIKTDIPLEVEKESTLYRFNSPDGLIEFLKGLGFKSAVKRVQDLAYQDFLASQSGEDAQDMAPQGPSLETQLVSSQNELDELLQLVTEKGKVSLYPIFSSEEHITIKKLEGVNLGIEGLKSVSVLFSESPLEHGFKPEAIPFMKELLSKGPELSMYDANAFAIWVYQNNFKDASFHVADILQMHFVENSDKGHKLSALVYEYFGDELSTFEKGITFQNCTSEEFSRLGGLYAHYIYELMPLLKNQLDEKELTDIYCNIDAPLAPILSCMQIEGVYLNKGELSKLQTEFVERLNDIETQIEKISGTKINLKSPKQMQVLLFETLGLPIIKKTKTGASTDVEVLEELTSRDLGPVPGLILQYRSLDKLLSTYIKALPEMLGPDERRIHTFLLQHVAATGRLSSQAPNLQNIPMRTEDGRRIRKAFIARPGHVLIGADYSQVELRLLAHFSNDPTMIEAFANGVDIHTQTASEVMGISIEDVSREDRSKAKAVNFGLMYGQSSFGLAKALRISRKEAKEYITTYFERFSKVKGYLDELKETCEEKGYSETYHGRKRFLPDIKSTNRTIKAMAERMAINSPIQGTAADIIKLAMIKINQRMKEEGLKSKMILQVHDELIFESPEGEISQMLEIITYEMENVVSLKVPLKVEAGTGIDWYGLK